MDAATTKRLLEELRDLAKKYNVVICLGNLKKLEPSSIADNIICVHRTPSNEIPSSIVVIRNRLSCHCGGGGFISGFHTRDCPMFGGEENGKEETTRG